MEKTRKFNGSVQPYMTPSLLCETATQRKKVQRVLSRMTRFEPSGNTTMPTTYSLPGRVAASTAVAPTFRMSPLAGRSCIPGLTPVPPIVVAGVAQLTVTLIPTTDPASLLPANSTDTDDPLTRLIVTAANLPFERLPIMLKISTVMTRGYRCRNVLCRGSLPD
jgi:hypothetical protein